MSMAAKLYRAVVQCRTVPELCALKAALSNAGHDHINRDAESPDPDPEECRALRLTLRHVLSMTETDDSASAQDLAVFPEIIVYLLNFAPLGALIDLADAVVETLRCLFGLCRDHRADESAWNGLTEGSFRILHVVCERARFLRDDVVRRISGDAIDAILLDAPRKNFDNRLVPVYASCLRRTAEATLRLVASRNAKNLCELARELVACGDHFLQTQYLEIFVWLYPAQTAESKKKCLLRWFPGDLFREIRESWTKLSFADFIKDSRIFLNGLNGVTKNVVSLPCEEVQIYRMKVTRIEEKADADSLWIDVNAGSRSLSCVYFTEDSYKLFNISFDAIEKIVYDRYANGRNKVNVYSTERRPGPGRCADISFYLTGDSAETFAPRTLRDLFPNTVGFEYNKLTLEDSEEIPCSQKISLAAPVTVRKNRTVSILTGSRREAESKMAVSPEKSEELYNYPARKISQIENHEFNRSNGKKLNIISHTRNAETHESDSDCQMSILPIVRESSDERNEDFMKNTNQKEEVKTPENDIREDFIPGTELRTKKKKKRTKKIRNMIKIKLKERLDSSNNHNCVTGDTEVESRPNLSKPMETNTDEAIPIDVEEITAPPGSAINVNMSKQAHNNITLNEETINEFFERALSERTVHMNISSDAAFIKQCNRSDTESDNDLAPAAALRVPDQEPNLQDITNQITDREENVDPKNKKATTNAKVKKNIRKRKLLPKNIEPIHEVLSSQEEKRIQAPNVYLFPNKPDSPKRNSKYISLKHRQTMDNETKGTPNVTVEIDSEKFFKNKPKRAPRAKNNQVPKEKKPRKRRNQNTAFDDEYKPTKPPKVKQRNMKKLTFDQNLPDNEINQNIEKIIEELSDNIDLNNENIRGEAYLENTNNSIQNIPKIDSPIPLSPPATRSMLPLDKKNASPPAKLRKTRKRVPKKPILVKDNNDNVCQSLPELVIEKIQPPKENRSITSSVEKQIKEMIVNLPSDTTLTDISNKDDPPGNMLDVQNVQMEDPVVEAIENAIDVQMEDPVVEVIESIPNIQKSPESTVHMKEVQPINRLELDETIPSVDLTNDDNLSVEEDRYLILNVESPVTIASLNRKENTSYETLGENALRERLDNDFNAFLDACYLSKKNADNLNDSIDTITPISSQAPSGKLAKGDTIRRLDDSPYRSLISPISLSVPSSPIQSPIFKKLEKKNSKCKTKDKKNQIKNTLAQEDTVLKIKNTSYLNRFPTTQQRDEPTQSTAEPDRSPLRDDIRETQQDLERDNVLELNNTFFTEVVNAIRKSFPRRNDSEMTTAYSYAKCAAENFAKAIMTLIKRDDY